VTVNNEKEIGGPRAMVGILHSSLGHSGGSLDDQGSEPV
jgi:hypothetical protein